MKINLDDSALVARAFAWWDLNRTERRLSPSEHGHVAQWKRIVEEYQAQGVHRFIAALRRQDS